MKNDHLIKDIQMKNKQTFIYVLLWNKINWLSYNQPSTPKIKYGISPDVFQKLHTQELAVLPEVGVEGEGARSSQGISVPVTWEDTQSTSTVRTTQETQNTATTSIWQHSLGSAAERHRRGDMRESFPQCAGRAGPERGRRTDFKKVSCSVVRLSSPVVTAYLQDLERD